jgi:hypothetical protein
MMVLGAQRFLNFFLAFQKVVQPYGPTPIADLHEHK